MQTHAVQFGKHYRQAGAAHSHAAQIGKRFFMPAAKSSGDKQHDAVVKQTEKWVSQTFYGELLKQMRNSPFKSKMFEGGEGGAAFNEMFDAQLADKMSKGAGRKLVDSIVNRIEANKAYGNSAKMPVQRKIAPAHLSPTLMSKIGATP